jgi:hypothetical protein
MLGIVGQDADGAKVANLDDGTELRTWPTLAHAWRSLNANRGMAALGIAALVIASLISFWPLRVAVLSYAQFELTYQSLADDGLFPRSGRRRLLPAIGVQLLVSLTIALGLMVLILPGIYLYLRLSLAMPVLIAEDAGVLEAIAGSWRRTTGQAWRLLGIAALAVTPALGCWTAMVVFANADLGVAIIAVSALAALLVTAVTFVFAWFVAAAAYAEGGGRMTRLEEVFV